MEFTLSYRLTAVVVSQSGKKDGGYLFEDGHNYLFEDGHNYVFEDEPQPPGGSP